EIVEDLFLVTFQEVGGDFGFATLAASAVQLAADHAEQGRLDVQVFERTSTAVAEAITGGDVADDLFGDGFVDEVAGLADGSEGAFVVELPETVTLLRHSGDTAALIEVLGQEIFADGDEQLEFAFVGVVVLTLRVDGPAILDSGGWRAFGEIGELIQK